ncbi:MAG: DEAD/DEAH box helicase family protein [Pseudomonadota bacterium]
MYGCAQQIIFRRPDRGREWRSRRQIIGSGISNNPTESLHFRYPWRDYQARVLDSIKLYLADQRLHIVAAPGSGKTTLGLEIFRQLGHPTLVLSPTRVIRDQWIERLRDFCPDGEVFPPAWTSRSLDEPAFLTSITYQALHTKYRDEVREADTDDVVAAEEEIEIRTKSIDEEEISNLLHSLETAGIRTLILDEAHHLRAEWWKALSKVVEAIEGMTVVSLTATPPYDSRLTEWKRYEELCGVIDEEISVPELVKAGTLCPHQDFVWTVVPTEYEQTYLDQYQRNVHTTTSELYADTTLERAVQEHSWVTSSQTAEDEIFARPDHAIALLVYLKQKQVPLPIHLMEMLDLQEVDVPELSDYWWQQIVGAYLYRPQGWPNDDETAAHRKRLSRTLRDRHLLRNRELQLSDARLVKRHMTQSSAKIQACVDIYNEERSTRGGELRQVILTDYIRDDGVRSGSVEQVVSLGAWPVFRAFANQLNDQEKRFCALLTGRLVIVHESVAEQIQDDANARPLDQLDGFCLLDSTSRNPVTLLTELLEAGQIHVLVGTRALLGEGWDAPCINSLILASNVGSYMLTNQMRGRAIRIDKKNPGKVSSIWHIVAIVLDRKLLDFQHHAQLFWPGLADFRELDNRFSTFVGVHQTESRIENNLLRLDLPYVRRKRDFVSGAEHLAFRQSFFRTGASLESTNRVMVSRLRQIQDIDKRWQVAIGSGKSGYVVPSVSPNTPPTARMFHFRRTLFHFLSTAIATFFTAAWLMAYVSPFIGIVFAGALVWSLPKFLLTAKLFLHHLPVDGTIHQIGLVVRDTLCATGVIENSAARLKVKSYSLGGDVYVNLDGGTYHEKSVFADCMEEILGPIENPRYLLVRHGATLGINRKDYHAVPTRIGVKKEFAAVFHKAWQRYVGNADLIYTRTAETKKTLLFARAKAFSAGTKKVVKRTDRWV